MKVEFKSTFSSDVLTYREYNFKEEHQVAAQDVTAGTLNELFNQIKPAVKETVELMKKYVPYSKKVHIHLRDVIYGTSAVTDSKIKISIGAPKYYAVWVEFGKLHGNYKQTPFFRRSIIEGLGKVLPVKDLQQAIKVDLGGMTR